MMKKINPFFYSVITGLFFLLLALSSCKTIRPVTGSQPPVTSAPTPAPPGKTEEPKAETKTNTVKRRFVLLMPFELEKNFTAESEESTGLEISPSSLAALNFLEGALMAADSLKQEKMELKINTYDAPSDSASIVKMMTNAIVKDADLVFATFPNNLAQVAAGIARSQNIKLILTQAGSPDILKDNANIALVLASTKTQCREMVDYMLGEYSDANIILIYRTVKREDELAAVFRQEIIKQKSGSDFKEFNATATDQKEIAGMLSKTKRNLIFLVSSDEAFVSPVLSQLEEQKMFGIKVSGLPTWNNFESIDFMNFNNLQIHWFDNNFIESDQPQRMQFRKSFISRFQMDPMPAAYNGFEMVYHLGLSLREPYSNMEKLMNASFKNQGLFNFDETVAGGIENKAISVLKINDYKLERLNK